MKINASSLGSVGRDLTGFAGAALLIEGVREIYAPAGLIVGGACLIAVAWQMARRH